MKAKNCLILSAGFGTRMQEIGKVLPKVLWPIGDKALIDLQIHYAKQILTCDKIFINVHCLKDQIINYLTSNHPDVEILIEDEILDVGGAIHNVANALNYDGNLLVLNGDVLLFSQQFNNNINEEHVLFLIKKDKDEGYNEVLVEDNKFKEIIKNKNVTNDQMYTYSGNSIINLNNLTPFIGKSGYFESCIMPESEVSAIYLKDYEYWDFGTLELYYSSLLKLLTTTNLNIHKFINKTGLNLGEQIESYTRTNIVECSLNDETMKIDFNNQTIGYQGIVQRVEL